MKKIIVLTFTALLTISSFANEVLRDDPKRPTAEIARDLGITQDQFKQCFSNVSPATQGEHPSADKVHSNKSTLLPCLKQANPEMTNNKLDSVMDKYRPGGHNAQNPH